MVGKTLTPFNGITWDISRLLYSTSCVGFITKRSNSMVAVLLFVELQIKSNLHETCNLWIQTVSTFISFQTKFKIVLFTLLQPAQLSPVELCILFQSKLIFPFLLCSFVSLFQSKLEFPLFLTSYLLQDLASLLLLFLWLWL